MKVYPLGIRAYDCQDEGWSDRSIEVHDCDDWQCDTAAVGGGPWTKADRQKCLHVLQERGLVP